MLPQIPIAETPQVNWHVHSLCMVRRDKELGIAFLPVQARIDSDALDGTWCYPFSQFTIHLRCFVIFAYEIFQVLVKELLSNMCKLHQFPFLFT
jgi:hypothetical protein